MPEQSPPIEDEPKVTSIPEWNQTQAFASFGKTSCLIPLMIAIILLTITALCNLGIEKTWHESIEERALIARLNAGTPSESSTEDLSVTTTDEEALASIWKLPNINGDNGLKLLTEKRHCIESLPICYAAMNDSSSLKQ